MSLITLYAKKVPTIDPVCHALGLRRMKDVALFKDRDCTELVARYYPDRSRPTRATKKITLNCWQWRIEWCN